MASPTRPPKTPADLTVTVDVITEDGVVIRQVPFGLNGRADVLTSVEEFAGGDAKITITAANLGASSEDEAVEALKRLYALLAETMGDDSREKLAQVEAWTKNIRPLIDNGEQEVGYEYAQEDVQDILKGVEQ